MMAIPCAMLSSVCVTHDTSWHRSGRKHMMSSGECRHLLSLFLNDMIAQSLHRPSSALRAQHNPTCCPSLSPLLRHPPCHNSNRAKHACIVRYKADSEEGAPTSSSDAAIAAAAKTEMMASAGVASASGVDLHSNGKSHSSSLHKLKTQVDSMASRYESLDRRLDSLESTLLTLLRNVKDRVRNPAAGAGVGPAGEGAAQVAAGVPAGALSSRDVPDYDYDEDEDSEGGIFDIKKLQANLSENINKGYMESVKHLRDMLMAYEWDLHGKELAGRRGVAKFEHYCGEKDIEGITFDVLSKLYEDPNNLDALPTDKLKLLARSMIQQTMDERYCSIYVECTTTAKELAHTGLKDIIPDSAGKVGGVIKDILPLPGFIKK